MSKNEGLEMQDIEPHNNEPHNNEPHNHEPLNNEPLNNEPLNNEPLNHEPLNHEPHNNTNTKPQSKMSKIKKIILGCVVVVISILITALIAIVYKLVTRKKTVTETKTPAPAPNSGSSTEPKINAPIRCIANELRGANNSIYRYIGRDTARWYPSPNIAASWDPNWDKYSDVNCTNMRLGPDMAYNIKDKPIGAPIRCIANELRGVNGSIYRNIGESTLSWYPNPEIASSWDPNWGNYSEIDCRDLTLGPNMAKR
jgi:hypothetical protein